LADAGIMAPNAEVDNVLSAAERLNPPSLGGSREGRMGCREEAGTIS